jgi:hypothetical protein
MNKTSLLAAALLSALALRAAGPGGAPQGHTPPGAGPGPHPSSPVKTGKYGELIPPAHSVEGGYRRVTPPALVKTVSGLADCKVSVTDQIEKFTLTVVSSLPLRRLSVLDAEGAEVAGQYYDDAVTISLSVPTPLTDTVTIKLDVNLGYDDGEQVVEQQSFDLKGMAVEAAP